MGNRLPPLLQRIHDDINDVISIANDAARDGETDIAGLLGTEVDHYFDFVLPEIALNCEEGGRV